LLKVTNKKSISTSLINWDELMEQIEIKAVPLDYVKSIVVKFLDGDCWEIDVSKKSKQHQNTEDLLESISEEYDNEIDIIEFRLNMEKVKTDIQKSTRKFLSKK